jgi:hypothetical protein
LFFVAKNLTNAKWNQIIRYLLLKLVLTQNSEKWGNKCTYMSLTLIEMSIFTSPIKKNLEKLFFFLGGGHLWLSHDTGNYLFLGRWEILFHRNDFLW